MLQDRRSLRLSVPAVLERVWIRKRSRFDMLAGDFPGVSHGVLWRALAALHAAGAVRRHRGRRPARGGAGPYWWKPSKRGLRLLAYLTPYRDWWEMLQPRDVRALAHAEGLFERLEAVRQAMVPRTARIRQRWGYWQQDDGPDLRGPYAPAP